MQDAGSMRLHCAPLASDKPSENLNPFEDSGQIRAHAVRRMNIILPATLFAAPRMARQRVELLVFTHFVPIG